jgi:hypothetical protein
MSSNPSIAKDVWTDADFAQMGWHDARVWALAFINESFEFLLDLDYILEWKSPRDGEEHYRFKSIPATLVFENVTDLRIDLEPFADLSLANITRSEPGVPRNAAYIGKSTDWLWHLDFHVGSIRLRSAGYKQYLRGPAIDNATQYLPLDVRGGLSFARSTHRALAV